LILDVWLPGQNGLDFQAQLARANVHLPVIFVSGHADVHAAVRAMKAGAFEFLTKPVRHEELLNAVKAAIALSIDQRDQLGGRRTAA
jgi:FixJ family two-component response regulator